MILSIQFIQFFDKKQIKYQIFFNLNHLQDLINEEFKDAPEDLKTIKCFICTFDKTNEYVFIDEDTKIVCMKC